MRNARKKWRLCLDLDDTLVPSTYKYHDPIWQCGRIITRALGQKSLYPPEVLKLHSSIDIELVKRLGFSPHRFPESWVRTYEAIAEQAKVPVDPSVCKRLLRTAGRFKDGPYPPFPGAKKALREAQKMVQSLHLVTAGDDALQRMKIEDCGLGGLFDSIHVTGPDKTPALAEIVGDRPDLGMMVGDSKKSDIMPAIKLGMTAVHVPSQTWSFANADVDPSLYHEIASIRDLPTLLDRLDAETKRRPGPPDGA